MTPERTAEIKARLDFDEYEASNGASFEEHGYDDARALLAEVERLTAENSVLREGERYQSVRAKCAWAQVYRLKAALGESRLPEAEDFWFRGQLEMVRAHNAAIIRALSGLTEEDASNGR